MNLENFLDTSPLMLFAQALGLCAMGVDLYATTRRNDRHFMWLMLLSSSLFVVHFIFLQAWTGMMAEALNAARSLGVLFFKRTAVGVFFIATYVAVGAFSATSLIEWLPFLASLIFTTAAFFTQGIKLRLWCAVGQACWVVYAVAIGSIGLLILDVLLILSTLRTVYYMKRDAQQAG